MRIVVGSKNSLVGSLNYKYVRGNKSVCVGVWKWSEFREFLFGLLLDNMKWKPQVITLFFTHE